MGLALIKGMGLGAGLMYFFDPELGRRRRALAADQFTHACCSLEDFFGKATRDLGNRAQGLTAELGHRFHREPMPSDEVLVERVRSILGRYVSHPRAIEVAAMNGYVVLRGPILAGEVDGVLQAASSVRGVVDVADELEIHRNQDHPALQGERPRIGTQSELWQENWSPATKLLIGAAGAAMAMPLIRRNPLVGLALGSVSLVLATRSLEADQRGGGRSASRGRARSVEMGSEESRSESGLPGGWQGRIDVTGRSGVYSASGPMPRGEAELRTPAEFVRGQYDDQGRQVEGGSELTKSDGRLLGGATPESNSPAMGRATRGTP
jgi:hypothetical protein